MNFKKFFFVVAISLIVTLSGGGQICQAQEHLGHTIAVSGSSLEGLGYEYTYVRVFKDGIWWIYVYDGNILVTQFPEDGM